MMQVKAKCGHCKTYQPIKDISQIDERRSGILTGRRFQVCRRCYTEFYRHELKDLSISNQQARLVLPGADAKDIKEILRQWSKNKLR